MRMDSKQSGIFNEILSSENLTFVYITAISIWGGIVSYFEKHTKFVFVKFMVHLSSAAFAGLMTGLFCDYMHVDGPLQYISCGIAAHMGTPAVISLLMMNRHIKAIFGKDETNVKQGGGDGKML